MNKKAPVNPMANNIAMKWSENQAMFELVVSTDPISEKDSSVVSRRWN